MTPCGVARFSKPARQTVSGYLPKSLVTPVDRRGIEPGHRRAAGVTWVQTKRLPVGPAARISKRSVRGSHRVPPRSGGHPGSWGPAEHWPTRSMFKLQAPVSNRAVRPHGSQLGTCRACNLKVTKGRLELPSLAARRSERRASTSCATWSCAAARTNLQSVPEGRRPQTDRLAGPSRRIFSTQLTHSVCAHLSRSGSGGARIRVPWFSARCYTISATDPTKQKKPDVVMTPGFRYSSEYVRPGVTCATDNRRAYSPDDRRTVLSLSIVV